MGKVEDISILEGSQLLRGIRCLEAEKPILGPILKRLDGLISSNGDCGSYPKAAEGRGYLEVLQYCLREVFGQLAKALRQEVKDDPLIIVPGGYVGGLIKQAFGKEGFLSEDFLGKDKIESFQQLGQYQTLVITAGSITAGNEVFQTMQQIEANLSEKGLDLLKTVIVTSAMADLETVKKLTSQETVNVLGFGDIAAIIGTTRFGRNLRNGVLEEWTQMV